MGKIIEANDHQTLKKRNRRVVSLRAENRGENIATNMERPFSILSEEEKNKAVQYCVDEAYKFYTSNNSQL